MRNIAGVKRKLWKEALTFQWFLYYNKRVYEKTMTKTVRFFGKLQRAGDGVRSV